MKTFEISGKERKKLKSELSRLNNYIKNFWSYYYTWENLTDMLGGSRWDINDAMKQIEVKQNRVVELELLLSKKYLTNNV